MKKKSLLISAGTVIVVLLATLGSFFINKQRDERVQDIKPIKVVSRSTPTYFFHGWGSSYHAEEKMVQAIRNAGITNSVIRVNVTKNGKVISHGQFRKNAKNPIIEVNFDDNKLSNYSNDYVRGYETAGARYVRNAIRTVNRKCGFSKVNIVAHSMGNLETAYFFKNYGNEIPVEHFVSIAGHYDGILGMNDKANQLKINSKTGKPSRMQPEYRGLLSLRKTFPRNTRVLNIYGNLENGTNSDGSVSNASSRSLRYLLNGRAKSYRELMIRGSNAQHSKLHNNNEVNQAIANFLWK